MAGRCIRLPARRSPFRSAETAQRNSGRARTLDGGVDLGALAYVTPFRTSVGQNLQLDIAIQRGVACVR